MSDNGWPVSWAARMAKAHYEGHSDGAEPEVIEVLLEAAGELKAVRLKILLARCYEVLAIAKANEVMPQTDDEFLDDILKEIK